MQSSKENEISGSNSGKYEEDWDISLCSVVEFD
jgi:hypothetical protein